MPCARGMRVATGTPGSGCKASCLHRQMVEEHRIERHAWELLLEAAANGHETEAEEFRAQYPGPTLRARLMANRRPDPEGEVFPWPVSTSSSEVA
ncbi:MAG: hypothetical protein JWQ74_1076 [Marmoricola sp.]|nr:hypothetical protein [Marmoricola sp.]